MLCILDDTICVGSHLRRSDDALTVQVGVGGVTVSPGDLAEPAGLDATAVEALLRERGW